MRSMIKKSEIKRFLGDIPLTAEIYWQVRQSGKPLSKNFSLRRSRKWLPIWISEASNAKRSLEGTDSKKVFIFTTLRYWIEHATLMGIALAGLGHEISLAFLPYANWHTRINRFDLRRHNAYAKHILHPAEKILKPVSLLDFYDRDQKVPDKLRPYIDAVSIRDYQYTLQVEEVDTSSDLYLLRQQRNAQAAQAALRLMKSNRPDLLLTPNGSILEMGAVYQVARYLDIPVVTYEFGEQRDRIWLAYNTEVMLQETNEMWSVLKETPLDKNQTEKIRSLYASRKGADLWENFSRRWQDNPTQGGLKVRQQLNLDSRPIILLAANVIGDSLTLGRQVFTNNMTEWLKRTILNFAERREVQLIIRIHPGERYTRGPSVSDVINQVIADLPDHIHLIGANEPINTYDLIEITDLGLVYTTTVGMEMAMSGIPVIVIGKTHYRGKGFTYDPSSWEEYESFLNQIISDPRIFRLTHDQVNNAWNYAYKFFFEYPCTFPWHLLHFWNELEDWSVSRVLSDEGQEIYGGTFRYLLGEPRKWVTDEIVSISSNNSKHPSISSPVMHL